MTSASTSPAIDPIPEGVGCPLPAPIEGVPLLGSAPALRRDLLGFLTGLDRDRGPVSVFKLGPASLVLIGQADGIEDVLVGKAEDFEKPDSIQRHGRLLFGNALSGLTGDAWRARRGVVAPAFHRTPVDAQAITSVVADWVGAMSGAPSFSLQGELSGVMTQTLTTGLARDARHVRTAESARTTFKAMETRLRFPFPLPDWLPLPPVSTMRRAILEMRRFVDERRPATDGHSPESADLYSRLTALRDENGERPLDDDLVRKEVSVMVGVGGLQLALTLGWALYALDTNPEARERLQEEIDSSLGGRRMELGDLDSLPFAAKVVEETLRLYPSIYVIFREAIRDTLVDGFRIPRGTIVLVSPWVTHRRAEYFERPEQFLPERWTEPMRRALPRAAYFPFGGGGRSCLAQAVARKQLTLALVTIAAAHRVRFENPSGLEPRAGVALDMPADVCVRIEARA